MLFYSLAGNDKTKIALNWILLFIVNYPEMQRRMRKEVEEQIGQRIPIENDKNIVIISMLLYLKL